MVALVRPNLGDEPPPSGEAATVPNSDAVGRSARL